MSSINHVFGTDDLFEAESAVMRHIEQAAHLVFELHGFGEIRTPILEHTALFNRSAGASSDVVTKEMFRLEADPDEASSVCLRPENTAGVARAMIEHGQIFADSYRQVYYVGPMFRRESPQAGRRRQFVQLGAETFGYAEPAMDVQIIACARALLSRLGIADVCALKINSLGSASDRAAYRDALIAYLSPLAGKLSEDSRRRLLQNPMRILDSKDEGDKEIIQGAPKITEYLSPESRNTFGAVLSGLDNLQIPYQIDTNLVRGLDYYTHTVFEFIASVGVGAQSAVAAGGRYDQLVEEIGGRPTPAVGFAAGAERLAMVMNHVGCLPKSAVAKIVLIGADEAGQLRAFKIAQELRDLGVSTAFDVRQRKIKSQLQSAIKTGVKYAAVIGSSEIRSDAVSLKLLDAQASATTQLSAASIFAFLSAPVPSEDHRPDQPAHHADTKPQG